MIIFLGDSIFEWWDQNIFNTFFSKFNPINFGKAGYTTKNVIEFLELTGFHSLKPDVIILLIGTNNSDHNYTTSQTFDEITKIIDLLSKLSPKSEIIILGILPRGSVPSDRKRILNEHINKMIENANFSKSVHYANVGYLFTDNDGIIPQDIMYDGLHLTQKAYYLLSEELSGFISTIFPSSKTTA